MSDILDYGVPCMGYLMGDHRELAMGIIAKTGTGRSQVDISKIMLGMGCLNGVGSIPYSDYASFDCKRYVAEHMEGDMERPGYNLCLACGVNCGERKMILDGEERHFLSWLVFTTPQIAKEALDTLEPAAFGSYSYIGKEFAYFDCPLCIPLAKMVFEIVKDRRGLLKDMKDKAGRIKRTDANGKTFIDEHAPTPDPNPKFIERLIDAIGDYCGRDDVKDFLRSDSNPKILWSYVWKHFLICTPVTDREGKDFIAERTAAMNSEPGDTAEPVPEKEESALEVTAPTAEKATEMKDDAAESTAAGEESSSQPDAPAGGGEPSVNMEEFMALLARNAELEKQNGEYAEKVEALTRQGEDEAKRADEAEYRASHDEMTGLFNKREYEEKGLTVRHDGVIYFDINSLKYVNDTFGHEKGDILIKTAAGAIASRFPLCYRIGGDEFAAFTDGIAEEDVKSLISSLKGELTAKGAEDESGIVYSVSAGFVPVNTGEDVGDAVVRAEGRMMADKKQYKKEHPMYDVRKETGTEEENKPEEPVAEEPAAEKKEAPDFNPPGELKDHIYFSRKVETTAGGYLSPKDNIRRVPMKNRRFLIPFAENDDSMGEDRNVIVHHEITSKDLEPDDGSGTVRKIFEIRTLSGDRKIETELDNLKGKAMRDRMVACEVAYVTDIGEYVLLLYNASSSRIDYFVMIRKDEGSMKAMPSQVIDILKSEGIKKVCYQPYLLCAMMGLYIREIEIKNVHAIYSEYHVFNEQAKGVEEVGYSGILNSYLKNPAEVLKGKIEYRNRIFGSFPEMMGMLSIYCTIARMQLEYSSVFGYDALCASRHRKDIMYGYSYLAAGVYPSMQRALFKLKPNGQFVFFNRPEPSISYFEGYMVQYRFKNIDADPGENGEKKEANEKANVRARQLLLKDLATVYRGFYHTNIKLLYFDEYHIIFYTAHNYLVQNQQFIETALKRECTMHKITTDQFAYSCWATTFDMVRLVNRH